MAIKILIVLYSLFVVSYGGLDEIKDVHLTLYDGATLNRHSDFSILNASNLITHPTFYLTKKTVFYIHGYVESSASLSVQTVVKAYITRGDHNIIFVDWSNMAGGSYLLNAAPNTVFVGKALGEAIVSMIKAGLRKSLVHIVGHSLGGQVSAFAGQTAKSLMHKLPRITALDPALPGFYPLIDMLHISKEDADFVDIIHTASGEYGSIQIDGTVDFRPNGGIPVQCGCPSGAYPPFSPEALCSHWRSWHFWAESLLTPTIFESVPCLNYETFLLGLCKPPETPAYMGYAASPTLSGNYYLFTASNSPYGRGSLGTDPENANCKLDVLFFQRKFNLVNEV